MRRLLGFALLAICTTACQCQRKGGSPDAGAGASATGTTGTTGTSGGPQRPRRVPRVGTVFGRVLLAEGATLPRWNDADIGRDPEVPDTFPECGNPRDSDTLPVRGVGSPTQLAGVMVSATGERAAFFDALGDWEARDRLVAIEDCRLTPKLVVATEGDTLVMENHTNLAFLPAAGPTEFYETLVRGQSRRLPLRHGGITTIRCGFAASCGRSEMVVIYHPVHTVSTAAGTFELTNVPADQPVQIHAWHPRFRDTMVETRVTRGGRVEVELTLTPLGARAATPAEPVPTAPTAPTTPTAPTEPPRAGVGPESDFPPGYLDNPTGTPTRAPGTPGTPGTRGTPAPRQ